MVAAKVKARYERRRRQFGEADGMTVLQRITITFTPEGIEYGVTHFHTDEPPKPGTKTRTARASRMARKGLEVALEGLGTGAAQWGGYATDTWQSTDWILLAGGGA
jgi:hypothetical protein